MLVQVMPAASAPSAFQTLSQEFSAMVGLDVVKVAMGELVPREATAVLYSMVADAATVSALPNARHIELFVTGDWRPTPGVTRVYPSDEWRREMQSRHGGDDSCVVIPHWCDPDVWAPSETQDYVLYVGRLWPQKYGLLPEIIKAMPHQRFIVAGVGDDVIWGGNVTRLGNVDRKSLPTLMAEARAVLCPTLYCEPFGLAAIESGMTGSMVLASNVGGFRETLPARDLIEPHDLGAWVSAIERTPPDAAAKAENRRRHIERHSPAAVAPQYRRIILEGVVTN